MVGPRLGTPPGPLKPGYAPQGPPLAVYPSLLCCVFLFFSTHSFGVRSSASSESCPGLRDPFPPEMVLFPVTPTNEYHVFFQCRYILPMDQLPSLLTLAVPIGLLFSPATPPSGISRSFLFTPHVVGRILTQSPILYPIHYFFPPSRAVTLRVAPGDGLVVFYPAKACLFCFFNSDFVSHVESPWFAKIFPARRLFPDCPCRLTRLIPPPFLSLFSQVTPSSPTFSHPRFVPCMQIRILFPLLALFLRLFRR